MNVRMNVNKKNKKEWQCTVLCSPTTFYLFSVHHGQIQESIEDLILARKFIIVKIFVHKAKILS